MAFKRFDRVEFGDGLTVTDLGGKTIRVDGSGGGLQYNIADTYGPHNIGDWLRVETTSTDPTQNTTNFTGVGVLFETRSIIFKENAANVSNEAEIGLFNGDWQGYMDGGQEIVYGQGGAFTRLTGGGNIVLKSTDSALPGSGDITIGTDGTVDDSSELLGSISLNTLNTSGGTGRDISVTSGHDLPATSERDMSFDAGRDLSATFVRNGSLTIVTADQTFVINDHENNPLVTYTG